MVGLELRSGTGQLSEGRGQDVRECSVCRQRGAVAVESESQVGQQRRTSTDALYTLYVGVGCRASELDCARGSTTGQGMLWRQPRQPALGIEQNMLGSMNSSDMRFAAL